MSRSIWIGYDRRERAAYHVARRSIAAHWGEAIAIKAVCLPDLMMRGLYSRPTLFLPGRGESVMWDQISDAPMSTEFAISRFLVPILARTGWALFMDCDVMLRAPIEELFALADPRYALMCVQHAPQPAAARKMDGQPQLAYRRKNWSSVMLINCDHPANRALDLDLVNGAPGRDLHGFCWLADDLIGALPGEWNHLVGVDAPRPDAKLAHFTLGCPDMAGYEACEHAEEWRGLRAQCPA